MTIRDILTEIDSEIAPLQQVRALLAGRARIAAAQKARWAKLKTVAM